MVLVGLVLLARRLADLRVVGEHEGEKQVAEGVGVGVDLAEQLARLRVMEVLVEVDRVRQVVQLLAEVLIV